ncbi:MAG: glycoside hydrolase family 2 [Phycisphaerae bacterium]|nr:glycoside hydrolase family 2 [Phycisphaerae bacterium]
MAVQDPYAEIAGIRQTAKSDLLIEPQPPALPERRLPSKHNPRAAFKPAAKIDTPAKLARALRGMRKRHAKFLADHAPKLAATRTVRALRSFDWRMETDADRRNIAAAMAGRGRWQRVDIPHYGEPSGKASALYRTNFTVSKAMLRRGAVFACFKGVDYIAEVYVNGRLVGRHEGFFSPFEFDVTAAVRPGQNVLLVRVINDAVCKGNPCQSHGGKRLGGDKIYAATGLGWDEPETGWHHCPPGMGIYHDVWIESRRPIHIHDVFVRPLTDKPDRAEVWVEVYSTLAENQPVSLSLSVFGQNFRKTVVRDRAYQPEYPAGPTMNYFRVPLRIPGVRRWRPEAPWLYQAQVTLLDGDGKRLDAVARQFGMRTFTMDETTEPRGSVYLNGREIRLRGGNTMGHLQQCVARGDYEQLRDDILLAKLCNMDYLRITQRPVQPEIYEYCDRLGLMTQTDLPLFGCLRRNQFCEGVRQAEEMERLVRAHPCNIMVSYVNEPFPVGVNVNKPHRQLTRDELEAFFTAADRAVRLANPDRVIKPIEGDYDPPGPGLPDNHCYCGWYNGHGVDLGKLHRGYWQPVKPGWQYACGEYGAEGLEDVDIMRQLYPRHWLPQSAKQEADWTPNRIAHAQTGRFHYLWFDTQHTLADWSAASQAHQARVTRLMTEAMRRDARMVSFAIHQFIDAFPAGWMKAIMDCRRVPKPAYFTYRDVLTPLAASIRTDRFSYVAGERMSFELWLCNDRDEVPAGATIRYQLELGREIVFAQKARARIERCRPTFQGHLRAAAPRVSRRRTATLRMAVLDRGGTILHETSVAVELFPRVAGDLPERAVVLGAGGKAATLARELGVRVSRAAPRGGDEILIDDWTRFTRARRAVDRAVRDGATAVFLELPPGKYRIAGTTAEVSEAGMNPRHFVSRATGHPLVAGFEPMDFFFWYDPACGYVTPILPTTFQTTPSAFERTRTAGAKQWVPILTTGSGDWGSDWGPALAAAELPAGEGTYRICQVALAGRTVNPVAREFAQRLLGGAGR